MRLMKIFYLVIISAVLSSSLILFAQNKNLTYPIVDTDQKVYYNNLDEIPSPEYGESFYGQDAQYSGYQPSYTDNGDGTITDNVTGLMWQKYLPDEKFNFQECLEYAENASIGGYTDWRLPTIKELYSLILFSGNTGMNELSSVPYIDTDYFDFRFGGTVNPSERFIDAQYATSTIYKGTTMGGQETMFGVNFVDGRIKGYPTSKEFEVKLVRGTTTYGQNDFIDNENNTITDNSTGLLWDKIGSSEGMTWEEALFYVQEKNEMNYLGYSDWRLPNAKELQSIVDYERSLSSTNSAAISSLFNVPAIIDEGGNTNYPFYWTSTTHVDGPFPNKAVYIAFGEALGFMQDPFGNYTLMDVHGAGAQRSDPKEGNPDDYPFGHGPQGDVIRIFNYVRLVRDADSPTSVGSTNENFPIEFSLEQNYPNPFNPSTNIIYHIKDQSFVTLKVFNILGQEIASLVEAVQSAGKYEINFDASSSGLGGQDLTSGVYFYQLTADNFVQTKKMILAK